MSGDEVMVLLVALAVAVVGWPLRLVPVLSVSSRYSPRGGRSLLFAGPALATAGLFVVLRTLASFDVRDDPVYLLFYLVLGAAWAYVGSGWWLGLHLRDDVAERGNRAAAVAWTGAVLGCTACYSGANIGDGPGWWCVVWAAGLATLGWTACWMALHAFTAIVDHVTIDRDLASGLRAGSFLLASGVLWGRGAAGDWTSAWATVLEMGAAWPVLILLAKAVLAERVARPTPERPEGDWLRHGLTPALLDVPLVYLGLWLAGPLPNAYPVAGVP